MIYYRNHGLPVGGVIYGRGKKRYARTYGGALTDWIPGYSSLPSAQTALSYVPGYSYLPSTEKALSYVPGYQTYQNTKKAVNKVKSIAQDINDIFDDEVSLVRKGPPIPPLPPGGLKLSKADKEHNRKLREAEPDVFMDFLGLLNKINANSKNVKKEPEQTGIIGTLKRHKPATRIDRLLNNIGLK